MSAGCSEIRTRCNKQARFSDSLMLRALATVSVGLAATSRLSLKMVNFSLRLVIWLIETGSTCCSECGSCYNELAQVRKPQILTFITVVSLVSLQPACYSVGARLFSPQREVTIFDILMCDINVEMLCQYDSVCLVGIDRYDNTINNVHVGTPAQVYTLDIANESLNCDVN